MTTPSFVPEAPSGFLGISKKDNLSLIGQFGVGFYSAFMVADKVEVISKGIGTKKSHHWTSDGQSSFTISETDKDVDGTEITLHIKKISLSL